MMKFITYIHLTTTIIITFLIFSSCNSISSSKKETENKVLNIIDTVIKDLPRGSDGKISRQYFLKDASEKLAGFNSLENGFDSLKIRFWYGYVFSEKEQVVEIANTNRKWTASLYNLTNKYYLSTDSVISVEKNIQYGVPKSGWEKFIQKLFSLDVLILPSYESIPEYSLPNDASGVNVEIATKNTYRIYFYLAPFTNQKRILQAKKMEDIMDLIEDEFNFKRISIF